MTAVLRFEKRNFADKTTTDGILRGIDNGGLIALKKHNERDEINTRLEVKSKQSENINTSLSKHNLYFKRMSLDEIKEIKNTSHRANTAGAFEMVFDFQDLTDDEQQNFDVLKHKKLIEGYLESIGITPRFKMLSFVYHADEKNPHFHAVFSAIDNTTGQFGINDYMNPKVVGDVERDKDGNVIYLIENRGKRKGLPMLDDEGNKIPKRKVSRRNGMQQLQDVWARYLRNTESGYENKKVFSSVLNFSKGVWRRFDERTKQRVYLIRKSEKMLHKAIREDDVVSAEKLRTMMNIEVAKIMQIAQTIQSDIAAKRRGLQRTKTLTPEIK